MDGDASGLACNEPTASYCTTHCTRHTKSCIGSELAAPQLADDQARYWRPRQDSNLRSRLRRAVLYPLSYGGQLAAARRRAVEHCSSAAGREPSSILDGCRVQRWTSPGRAAMAASAQPDHDRCVHATSRSRRAGGHPDQPAAVGRPARRGLLHRRGRADGRAAEQHRRDPHRDHDHRGRRMGGRRSRPTSAMDRPRAQQAAVHTHDTTNQVWLEGRDIDAITLGQFFTLWAVRFDGRCLGAACVQVTVTADGQPVTDPRALQAGRGGPGDGVGPVLAGVADSAPVHSAKIAAQVGAHLAQSARDPLPRRRLDPRRRRGPRARLARSARRRQRAAAPLWSSEVEQGRPTACSPSPGCSVTEIADQVGTPAYVVDEARSARPGPRLRRGVRRLGRLLRGEVVPLHRRRPLGEPRRVWASTSAPAASWRWSSGPGSTCTGSACTATTRASPSCARR